jgi:hypothetical protein
MRGETLKLDKTLNENNIKISVITEIKKELKRLIIIWLFIVKLTDTPEASRE